MKIQSIVVNVKSQEEIKKTLSGINVIGKRTYATFNSSRVKGEINIPDFLWGLCEKEINVDNCESETHQYDFKCFCYPKPNSDNVSIPVIYFMKEWVEEVGNE